MLFAKRQDYLGPYTGNALGAQIAIDKIARDYLIESIFIIVDFTTPAAKGAATQHPDGPLQILKRAVLTVQDGARSRNVVDVSGAGLVEYAQAVRGVPGETAVAVAAGLAADTAFRVVYPIFFRMPQVSDPLGMMTLLPTNRMSSNPVLTLYLGTQADLDQAAAPTLELTAAGASVTIVVNRRVLGVTEWPLFDTELIEATQSYPASATGQLFELPTPGAYTGILTRGYSGAAPTIIRSPKMLTNGEVKLQVLGTVLRRIQPYMARIENCQPDGILGGIANASATIPKTASASPPWWYLDFLNESICQQHGDLGSVLDVNGLVNAGARAQLLSDVDGGTGVMHKYVWHRIYGNLASTKGAMKLRKA